MPKQKTTIYLDSDVLSATKAAALTSHRTESAVVEAAIRAYLGGQRGRVVQDELRDLMDRVASRSALDEEAALKLAVQEVDAVRQKGKSAEHGDMQPARRPSRP